ncbi:phage tail tube protein [Sebaldella sp. S0638]|uniref:phage tail tube protein n=1 Tax=Sebaldella sp. S0638 TaxID=2957809 RepID=UPI00209E8724|nr:phage tail tube protein [Sebaldella sp. S0638]MCP1226665.1 phage tail tube protein [Sebaldella sp. S0638]
MNGEVLIGVQTGKGTAETNTMSKVNATDYGITPSTDSTTSEALGSGRFVRDGFLSKVSVEGDIPVEVNREQLELLLHGAGYTGAVDGLADWKLSPTDTINQWLTVGFNDLDNNMFEYAVDCLVSSLSISTAISAFVTATISLIGMDHKTKNTKYANTIKVLNSESLICLGATIKESGTDITSKIESIDMTFDNKLEGKQALNSVYYKAITQSDRGTTTLGLTFNEFDKDSYLAANELLLKNGEYEVEVVFALMSDTTKTISFVFPRCKVSKNERTDISGSGGLSKELEAFYDETIKSPVSILFKDYTSIM